MHEKLMHALLNIIQPFIYTLHSGMFILLPQLVYRSAEYIIIHCTCMGGYKG